MTLIYRSKEESTAPMGFDKNLMGANVDVISKLEDINFESSFDGSLKNAVAYITPWERTGFSPKNKIDADWSKLENSPYNDILLSLENDLGTDFLEQSNVNLETSFFEIYSDSKDFTFTALGDQENSLNKQKALRSEVPIGIQQGIVEGGKLLAGEIFQDGSQMERYVQTGINQVAGKVFNIPSGPIYIGNENGSLNQIISGISDYAAIFGVNIPRGLTTVVRPDTQSSESKSLTIKNGSSAEVDGVWQFLFNPSELELVAGPEYNKSETWGVMDNANAGAPKSFQAMRNPELKFSGVKLNGYVFGKKVEDLEQGLFELFMTPGGGDNGTSNGPQVLEFVWGKRTFGPCIIKDVRVTEKMWDDGLLVSADVNFTLEKIPEWTINDGQVSVYTPFEPGTQPTQVKPEENVEELPDEEEKTEPPEKEPPEKESSEALSYKLCNQQINFVSNLNQLKEKASEGFFEKFGRGNAGKAQGAQLQFSALLTANASVMGRISGVDSKCLQKCNRSLYREKAGINFVYFPDKQLACIRACCDQIVKKVKDVNKAKCPGGFTPQINPG